MKLPTAADYQDAIQYPDECFADPELRAAEPTFDPLGLPRALSGNFATVFELVAEDGRRYAVRCFARLPDDQAARYRAIHSFMDAVDSSWKVGSEYLTEGIRIGGEWFPVVKMDWVDGQPLDRYVESALGDPDAVLDLARRFALTVADLRARGAAHGDLQHGNVLVTDDLELKLIDYDGMFVPALSGRNGSEVGHRNYQHPARTKAHFGHAVDNFSAWIIYVSLIALAIEPGLWARVGGGEEKLILSREDFTDPAVGLGLRAMEVVGDERLTELAGIVRANLDRPPLSVEELHELSIAGSTSNGTRKPSGVSTALHSTTAPPEVAPFGGDEAFPVRVAVVSLAAAVVVVVLTAAGVLGAFAFGVAAALAAIGLVLPPLAYWRSARFGERRELQRRAEHSAAALEASQEEVAPLEQAVVAITAREREAAVRVAEELSAHQRGLAEDVQVLRKSTEQDLAVLDDRRHEVIDLREQALTDALAQAREQAYGRELARTQLRTAAVRGIGSELIDSLEIHGVRNPSDFTGVQSDASADGRPGPGAALVLVSGRLLRLPGLTADRIQALERWRLHSRRLVEAEIPTALTEAQHARVTLPFDAALAELDDREHVIRRAGATRVGDAQERRSDSEREAAEIARQGQSDLVAQRRTLELELARAERSRLDAAIAASGAAEALAAYREITFAGFIRGALPHG